MIDQDLIQRAEHVHEKLLKIRKGLYDLSRGKAESTPERTAWHDACVALHAQSEMVDELKRRRDETTAPGLT